VLDLPIEGLQLDLVRLHFSDPLALQGTHWALETDFVEVDGRLALLPQNIGRSARELVIFLEPFYYWVSWAAVVLNVFV